MPDNSSPAAAEPVVRPGSSLRQRSLAPKFKKKHHQLYFELLARAIEDERNLNVALTGAYGTGKSSILQRLAEEFGNELITVSLSTVAPEAHDGSSLGELPEEATARRTEQIQKEIVKQLLYRLKPSQVPQSRFHRADLPDRVGAMALSLWTGIAFFVVLMGLGVGETFIQSMLHDPWRQAIGYVVLLLAPMVLCWAILTFFEAKPVVSATVNAGPAVVSLKNREDSYFDKYLDEIVYFFQASSTRVLVIEDIDRFEDVRVFDTLRALNGLLNSSGQVGRRVVFVYAIRDSVFEQIGQPPARPEHPVLEEHPDHAKSALKRASRTKFFDVIVPVVPFVSADNARDVMSHALRSREFQISSTLVRVAARHVADMRLIHNIRNEFEIFRHRLVVPKLRVHGISDDLVFAMVLYKNTHLADFEKIRYKDSRLDLLYSLWRRLVSHQLEIHTERREILRQELNTGATVAARARRLGERLSHVQEILATAVADARATVTLDGPVTAENVNDPEAWAEVTQGTEQTFTISPRIGDDVSLSLGAEQLAELLNVRLIDRDWYTADLQAQQDALKGQEEILSFLRHHTWKELYRRDEFTLDVTGLGLKDASGAALEGPATFEQLVQAVLASELARDLVEHGFLTSNFALYTASYYGTHLGPDAMEYLRRCIEPGVPDASFALSPDQVAQLLQEQDAHEDDTADLFSDQSIFNLSILDYLVERRPGALRQVAQRLARMGNDEKRFVDLYTSQGVHPQELLAALTPWWPGALNYAAQASPNRRPALLEAVLHSLTTHRIPVGPEVKAVLEDDYRNLPSVSTPTSTAQAQLIYNVVAASGALLSSLAPLNDLAREAAIDGCLYPISVENYRVVFPEGAISLDRIRKEDRRIYQHTLKNLRTFLQLTAGPDVRVATNPDEFAAVLNDAAEHADARLLDTLIKCADESCVVPLLIEVNTLAWPALLESNRSEPTFNNVSAYIGEYGVDGAVGGLLRRKRSISSLDGASVEDRQQLAVTLLGAKAPIPPLSTRMSLAASLRPGTLDAVALTPESGKLVSRLMQRRLLSDDANAFSKALMVDWQTFEATALASKKLDKFISPDIVPIAWLPRLIKLPGIPDEVTLAVLSDLDSYLTGASPAQVRAVADALLIRWRLDYKSIVTLQSAGATDQQIVRFIHKLADKLSDEKFTFLLTSLGGPYEAIAEGGQGSRRFANDDAHSYILGRLQGKTIGKIKLKSYVRDGLQLTAYLITPS